MRLLDAILIIALALGSVFYMHYAKADSVELIGGSLTYHPIDFGTAHKYSYQLNDNGRLIDNPILGISYIQEHGAEYTSETAFIGKDSVGGDMSGVLLSEGFDANGLQFGPAIGLYLQAAKPYDDLNINDYKITRIRGIDFVPVLGIALNYKINLSKKTYIQLNNIISPVIINSTLAIGYNF